MNKQQNSGYKPLFRKVCFNCLLKHTCSKRKHLLTKQYKEHCSDFRMSSSDVKFTEDTIDNVIPKDWDGK